MTYSLIPSLKKKGASPRLLSPFVRQRSGLVSLSTNSSSAPRGQRNTYLPSFRLAASSPVPRPAATRMTGLSRLACRQVFRNHSVGRRWRTAGFAPRLTAVISINTSSGPALAYSTNTSK
jgi:hypothetical protein